MLLARADRIFNNFLNLAPSGSVLKKIRAHRMARQQATDDAHELFNNDKESGAFDGTFFEWLMSHMDEIITLITKIITLFGI